MIQSKGNISLIYGKDAPVSIKGLAESAISYEIGELGDTIGSLTDVVHIVKSKGSVVSTITVNCLKNSTGLSDLLLLIQTGIPLPLTVKDNSMNVNIFMSEANPTSLTIGDSTGGTDAEEVGFVFKGNIALLEL
jgi:hypothetical protein